MQVTAETDHIGKYRILDRLGEGATSEVFRCHDPFNDRDVAIKRMKALGGGNDRVSARFFASEAALVGQLNHPNVVRIYDAVTEDPVGPYLVMEYVAGTTLRSYCRPDCLLPLDQIIEIGFKCAMALNYCNRQGLIHRDVKPANILVAQDGDAISDIKISDFGSVLNLHSEATQIFRVGSLAYMSPEQLDGSTLDSHSDMYSLGAVLFHLISGTPPFDGSSQTTLMRKVCFDEVPSLLGRRAGVSPELDALVMRALAKKPDERFADWESFANALSDLVRTHAVPVNDDASYVLDSERFRLLRGLDFFQGFDDIALWEVVHRATWQRYAAGEALSRRGDTDRTFHIIAKGTVEVYRDGLRVAHLSAGTSVGEMAYLAPSPELRQRTADVIVTETATTVAFTPDSLGSISTSCRQLFDAAFIRVLVRRLHAAHEALAHPRRIL